MRTILAAHDIVSDFHTERQALRWVQKYISAFGGDPTKVTMYDLLLCCQHIL